jgi:hypothetical protein
VRPLGGVIGFEYEERKGDPMSKCSTWHGRIDLVDDGTLVTARAKLIGAGVDDSARLGSTRRLLDRRDQQRLAGGLAGSRSLTSPPVLAHSLSSEHCAHFL